MELSNEVKNYIDKSVLCWLATVSSDLIPNVSPKEIFTYYKTNQIIIANIASLQSFKNIKQNKNVCLSFIDILVQKGFQIKGNAEIISKSDNDFEEMEKLLLKMTAGKFPFASIINITVNGVKPVIAPKYLLYPETTEEEQIKNAKLIYGL